jgi:hypothetical protein
LSSELARGARGGFGYHGGDHQLLPLYVPVFPRGPVTVPPKLHTPPAQDPAPFRVQLAPLGAVTVFSLSQPLPVRASVELLDQTPPLGPVHVPDDEQAPPAQEPLA